MARSPLKLTPDPASPSEMVSLPLNEWAERELERPDVPWLLKDLIMPGGLTIMAGRAKLGKSFWSMLMGMAMSSGQAFGPIKPIGRSSCLYLDLEGVARKTAERVTYLSRGMGISMDSLGLFRMADQREFQLLASGAAARLVKHIRTYSVQTVFLDTFARTFTGDENNKKETQKFLDVLSEVRAETGCAAVLVHHVNKQSFAHKDVAIMMDADAGLRGSSAIAGAYDVIVTLQDGWVEGEFQKFAVSRGKYTDDWWCPFDLVGTKDDSGNWTETRIDFSSRREGLALIERGPSDRQPGIGHLQARRMKP